MNNKRQNKQPLFAEVKTLDDNQRAKERAAKVQISFELAMTDFTEQLRHTESTDSTEIDSLNRHEYIWDTTAQAGQGVRSENGSLEFVAILEPVK